jgi:hypothetical protein
VGGRAWTSEHPVKQIDDLLPWNVTMQMAEKA